MKYGRTRSVALVGLDGVLVDVEADVSPGLPAFTLVGLPDSSLLQARDRVRAACHAVGLPLVAARLTVNLAPADLRKTGSGHDLPIAAAVLAAQGLLPMGSVDGTVHLGELGLDGTVRPVAGVLPSLLAASRAGVRRAVVPPGNVAEANLVPDLEVLPVADLGDLVALHRDGIAAGAVAADAGRGPAGPQHPAAARLAGDFADLVGQEEARRAAVVSAAGGHHLLLVGPPGTGKTSVAARIPSILPPLTPDESVELSAVHSLAGTFDARGGLLTTAPFEAPHHTASVPAVIGGGSGLARPGALSRAHGGVLFLDEAPEFRARVLEALREPLEEGNLTLHRAHGRVTYPARIQLVLAANPCPCGGAWGTGASCTCTPFARRRYLSRLSGPVLDRIDLRSSLQPLSSADRADGASSPDLAARVLAARERQRDRLADTPWSRNSEVPGTHLRTALCLPRATTAPLDRALARQAVTMRGYDRILRISWTLADLDDCPTPGPDHLAEAMYLREGASA